IRLFFFMEEDNKESEIEEIEKEREVELARKVEAALFIAGKFLSLKELVALTDINPILLRKTLEDLKDRYKDSALEIVNKNELWKMDVSGEYVSMVNKLATGNTEFTKAEQETLAIIAYKQPIKQSVLVKIRGNKAYEHIKNFVNLELVVKKRAGHTYELGLSDTFYDYFNVEQLETGKGGE
ncbi:MAG: SMC-Scp complex subunit ScpB, partial [Nanoarchaeota archaeon]